MAKRLAISWALLVAILILTLNLNVSCSPSNNSDLNEFSDLMHKELDAGTFDHDLMDDQKDVDNHKEEENKEIENNPPDKSKDEEEDKNDAYNRIVDLLNEESDNQNLDDKSINLSDSFDNFNAEIVKIYREELSNLRKNPEDVFKNKKKMESLNITALEQNSDPIFYNWFAFSLTINKIIFSLTHSMQGKFMEHADLALTPKCMLSMLVALDEMKEQKLWVIKMIDTTGKPEFHNILDGSIISLGGYDQCLAIESPKILRGNPGKIYGKYCLVKYDIPLPKRPTNIGIKTQLFNYTNTRMEGTAVEDFASFSHALYEHKPRIGFCIPSQCTEGDLQLLLNLYFKNSTMSSKVSYCYSNNDPEWADNLLYRLGIPMDEMTDLQMYILLVYCSIILIVILGTIVDLWFSSKEQQEIIKINKLSEDNLKIISNLNGRPPPANRSFDQSASFSRYFLNTGNLPTPNPSALPTPSTGRFSEDSPFFMDKKSFEMKNLDAESRRRLFRSQNVSVNTLNTLNPQFSTIVPATPSIDELNQFTVPDSFKLFNYWKVSKKNRIPRTLIAFSIYTNARRLFRTSNTTSDALDSLHGIRVVSMLWIVLTHTYLLPIKSTMIYSRKFLHVSESYLFQFIVNGWVLVDSFFFIGSLLVTFNQLRTLNRTDGKINLFRIVIARLIRISPSLWFVISFLFVLPLFVKGPLVHEYMDHQLDYCRSGWYLNALFINNWFPYERICLLHSWYLSADFQMYVTSLFLIMVLYKWPTIGLGLSMIGIVASCVGTFIFTYVNNHPPTVVFNSPIELDTMNSAAEIYTVTFPHIAPYCLGIIAGFVLFKSRTYKINGYIIFVLWITTISLAFTILMWTQRWNRGEPWTPLSSAMYAGIHRILWALVLFWITFACSTAHGGFINSFLGWSFFKFLSKLSFPCYLVHFVIIWARLSYGRTTLGFSHYTMVCEYAVNVVFSLIASIILYLCVELPSINLYNVFFAGSFEFLTIKLGKVKKPQCSNIRNNSSFWFS